MPRELLHVLAAASSWSFAFSCFGLLPSYLVRELHASPSEIGLVTGVFGCASFALTPLSGAWIDRYRHRRTMAAGSAVAFVSALAFLFVDSVGPAMLVLRVAQALSHALVTTAVGIAVAEIAPPARLSQAFGLGGASILVMNALAPAVAEPLAEAAGWSAVFVLSAAVALLAVLLARRLAEPPALELVAGESTVSMLAVLRRPVAIHYSIVVVLIGLGAGIVFTFQQPYALALGRERVRGFLVAWAAAAIVVRLFLGHLPDRLGRQRVAVAALLTYAVGAAAMAAIPGALMEVMGAVFGLAHGLCYPALNAIAVGAVPRRERGRLMAIFTGAFNLGVAGTALLGPVAELTGYPALFLAAAASMFASASLLATSKELRDIGTAPIAAAPPVRVAS
jgi:MFS family permease